MSDQNHAAEVLLRLREAVVKQVVDHVCSERQSLEYICGEGGFGVEFERLEQLNQMLVVLGNLCQQVPYVGQTEPLPAASTIVVNETYTWEAFLAEANQGTVERAATIFAVLAQLDHESAYNATAVFAGQLAANESLIRDANSLRAQLRISEAGSLAMLANLFGLEGVAGQHAYHYLRMTV